MKIQEDKILEKLIKLEQDLGQALMDSLRKHKINIQVDDGILFLNDEEAKVELVVSIPVKDVFDKVEQKFKKALIRIDNEKDIDEEDIYEEEDIDKAFEEIIFDHENPEITLKQIEKIEEKRKINKRCNSCTELEECINKTGSIKEKLNHLINSKVVS